MPVSINNKKRLISVGDVEPSALDLSRHMLPGESISSISIVAGAGLAVTTSGEVGAVNTKYGRTNRDMIAGKFIKWSHTAVSPNSSTQIDITFSTNLGQTKKLKLNFEVIS